ncbi:hypothetical protein BvCms2454_04646 [Escherichia coli]|nr:hypothetical protein BvCms2454_04646 [Escherichia coli]
MIDSNAKLRSIQMPFCKEFVNTVGGPFRQYAQNMAQIRFRIDTVQTAGACFSGNKQESQR